MTNLFEIPAIHTLQQLISVMNATCLVECVLISESAVVLIFGKNKYLQAVSEAE